MRKAFFWLHLSAGVIAGLAILAMCVTGVLLTYERQINSWADHRALSYTPPPAGSTRLTPEALLAKAREQREINPNALVIYADAATPAEIPLGREGSLYVDPYTGKLLGQSTTGTREFFGTVTAIHRWAGMSGPSRATGKSIMDAGNLIFFFIVLSGLYLWFPRKMSWQRFKPVVLFRGGLPPKARDFNWHNVIGVWAWVPLFLIVGSGVVMSYQWANSLVYTLTSSPIPAPGGPKGGDKAGPRVEDKGGKGPERAEGRGPGPEGRGPGGDRAQAPHFNYEGLDRAWATAERQQAGWASIRAQVSGNPAAPIVFNIDQGNGGQPQARGTLTVARATGDIVSWAPYSSGTLGQRVRIWLRFTHTGESMGIVGQTIAGLATTGGCVMVYTGIALSLRRLFAWRRRRTMKGQREPERVAQLV